MSNKKKQVKRTNKNVRKHRPAKPVHQSSIASTEQVNPVVLQRVGLDPGALTPADILQLQHTIGNKEADRLLDKANKSSLNTLPIQRLLDEDKYSPDALRGARLKAGFRLFGKTSFGKLTDALKEYFDSNNTKEQYISLNKVLAACNKYLASQTRSKKHKGAQKTREENKQALVDDLKHDVEVELDTFKADPDPSLLGHLSTEEPETALILVANKLAQELAITLEELKGMSVEDLKIEYIEKVYLDYKMKRAANEDTGEKGKLYDQINGIFTVAPIDASKLPDEGDVKELYDKLAASSIGKTATLLSEKAPKFVRGGKTDEYFQPEVEDWSDKNQIEISGNEDFRDKIKGLIDVIKEVPVGLKLLKELGTADAVDEDMVHAEAKNTVVSIAPPAISSVSRFDAKSGQYMYAASAGSSSLVIDPDNPFVGPNLSKGETEKWRIRDAAIGLFHEMIHAYLHKIGGEDFESKEDPEKKIHVGALTSVGEVRTTGVPYEKEEDGNTYTFPFDDSEYNYISENTFRKEFGKAQGLEEVYLRPSYGTERGQRPLPLTPTKIK